MTRPATSLGQGLSIAAKGLLLVAVPVIAQIAVLLLLRSVQASVAEAERMAIHSKDVLLQTDEIHRLAVQAIASQRGAIISAQADYRESGDPDADGISRRLEALARFVSDNPLQQQRAASMTENVRELERWIASQRALIRDGRRDAAAERVRSGEGSERLARLRGDLATFLSEETRLSEMRATAMRDESERSRLLTTLAAAVSLGIACVFAFLFSREISSRFSVVTDNAARMAAGEPLAPPLGGTDEIARLDAVLHATSRRLDEAADAARRARQELERRLHQLNELNEQLRQQTAENETFIYSVSHDLRSPLVNLQGFSKELVMTCDELKALVEQDADPQTFRARAAVLVDREIAESIRYIRTAVSRAGAISASLLRLSRAGRVEYRPQPVPVAEVVRNIVDAMRSTINDRKADVRIGRLDDAWGDPTAIEQVFANLIGNAVGYLDPARPGRVEVGMVELEPARPGVRTYYVRDNGLGIPRAALDKVFTAFQRYHASHAVGEGIGLALVRRIVDRHRGRIWVESQEGAGSTVYVELPDDTTTHGNTAA
jgi:signal transduction histidine kinase